MRNGTAATVSDFAFRSWDGVRTVAQVLALVSGTGVIPMLSCQRLLTLFCAVALFAMLGLPRPAPAAEKDTAPETRKVAGILIDKKPDWALVKPDGEDEPVKYLIGKGADKKLLAALKTTYDACRVQLTYKTDGDSRQLVGIRRQVLRASGTVTGTVVKVYNDFWVEVKPRNGLSDAYAPGVGNFKNKEFMAKLKGLKKGDSVTISFNTDFERHRILALRINAPKPK